jgi:hypothetical protein
MSAHTGKIDFSDLLSIPIANSDGCGFIVRFISRQFAGLPNAYFIAVGKHEWYIGSGQPVAFWGPEVFESVKALLLQEIDTYSIDETLNVKALGPIITSIISDCQEIGEVKYDEMIENLRESQAEYASSFNWNSSDYFCDFYAGSI